MLTQLRTTSSGSRPRQCSWSGVVGLASLNAINEVAVGAADVELWMRRSFCVNGDLKRTLDGGDVGGHAASVTGGAALAGWRLDGLDGERVAVSVAVIVK